MKNKSKVKKIIIIALIIVLAVIISPFAYTEYMLITGEGTKATDIDSVFKVNHGSDFEVLRTIYNKNNGHDELIVMVKYDHVFKDYLVNELGCTEYDRLGAAGFYETKGGKKFSLVMRDRSSDAITRLPYAIEKIEDVTMDEILADSKIS